MITFNNVGKGYRAKGGEINWVFRNFTGSFPDGVSIGVLARKGGGKTTLANLLSGVDIPSEGRLVRKSAVSFPFNFRAHLVLKLTVRQNVRFVSDLYGRDFKALMEEVDDFAELGGRIDTRTSQLTGEQRLLLGARLFFSIGFSHMVFDEMGPFGSPRVRRKIYELIAAREPWQSLIIMTGNPENLRRHCDTGAVLDKGRLELFDTVEAAIAAYGNLRPDFDLLDEEETTG